ncbi:unnamed protein product [Owenia fusiformis]|uniref:Uncharacterized protein n=1 Tax=Owenia fusiformis TaxID=6347 RepID=A0A8S4PCJ2_OWEFU|nr:unnamed protein product [Owenia fusiformis]
MMKTKLSILIYLFFTSSMVEGISREKRGLEDLGNYGNWCGAENTGIGKVANCDCDFNNPLLAEQKCRAALPPIDALDDVCLKHDNCVQCDGLNKLLHTCECERDIAEGAKSVTCGGTCAVYKTAVIGLFTVMPCLCTKESRKCGIKWCRGWWGIPYPCGWKTCHVRVVGYKSCFK